MSLKLYARLFVFLLSIFTCFAARAQNARTTLLKGVGTLPLPPEQHGTALFYTINEQPEVIAMARLNIGQVSKGTAMIASKLGKGKLLLLGSPQYFKGAMLADKNVSQLLKNSLLWAGNGKRNLKIAITPGVGEGMAAFLKKQGAKTYTIRNLQFQKNTNLLVLDQDITKPDELKRLDAFISNGGALLFGSPYSDIYANRDTTKTFEAGYLKINTLFAKAGVANPNMTVKRSAEDKPEDQVLTTDSIPDYLQLKTLLPMLANLKEPMDYSLENYMVMPMLDLVFEHNAPGAPIYTQIKQLFKLPEEMPVPTPAKPLENYTAAQRIRNRLGYRIYNKQQNFDKHPTAKARGYEAFPGAVPDSAKRVTETLTIPVLVGKQGLWDPESPYSRAHSTGLYVPAGEQVTITIDPKYVSQRLQVQIGVHDDDLQHLDMPKRTPLNLTETFILDTPTIKVYSPYGGLLLINISDTTTLKSVSLKVAGAVKAPYFRLGETTNEAWNTIRNNPAPWAELATDKIILTVPSYRIRNLSDPVKLMQFWDEVMDADADLSIINRKRVHAERIIVDADVAWGYMYTQTYKIVQPDDQSCEWMLNEPFMRSHGSWGTLHELGHRHQFWGLDYPGISEVTVNLFTMYVYDKVLHKGLYNHDALPNHEAVIKQVKNYLNNNPTYEKWSSEPFIALSMYIQLIEKFGWEAIIGANTIYRNLPKDQYPKTDQERRDLWFLTICKTTNSNLTRFFEVWKLPVSDEAKKKVANYKEWFPVELEDIKS